MFSRDVLFYFRDVYQLNDEKYSDFMQYLCDHKHKLRGKTFSKFQLYILDAARLVKCTAAHCGHWHVKGATGRIVCTDCVNRKEHKSKARNMTKEISQVLCEKKQLCSMCMSNVKKNTKASCLPCGHQFHESCIMDWLIKYNKNSCPYCRTSVVK